MTAPTSFADGAGGESVAMRVELDHSIASPPAGRAVAQLPPVDAQLPPMTWPKSERRLWTQRISTRTKVFLAITALTLLMGGSSSSADAQETCRLDDPNCARLPGGVRGIRLFGDRVSRNTRDLPAAQLEEPKINLGTTEVNPPPAELNSEQQAIINSLRVSASQKAFLRKMVSAAIKLQASGKAEGINLEVMIRQAIQENGWRESGLMSAYNNPFGMKYWGVGKATPPVLTWENANGHRVNVYTRFRAFDTLEEGLEAYAEQVRDKFPGAVGCVDNPYAAVNGLRGYATDPSYATSVLERARQARLHDVFAAGKRHKTSPRSLRSLGTKGVESTLARMEAGELATAA